MAERSVKSEQGGGLFLPPGFRFHPTDEEVITSYLLLKFLNPSFDPVAMGEVDLNKCEPRDLRSKAKMGEKEWYFFCHKDMKYPTGSRTNRATKEGYWKATGKDREIFKSAGGHRELVGMKKTLVFYRGRAPKGTKTNWVMHEFRLEGKSRHSDASLRFDPKDEWVVCKVFHKEGDQAKKAAEESSAGTPNASSVEAAEAGDESFFDSMILDPASSLFFNSAAAGSLPLPLPSNADYPICTAAAGTTASSAFAVDPPANNYTAFNDTTSINGQHQVAVADSTAPGTSCSSTSSWNTALYATDIIASYYDSYDQAMMVKALEGVTNAPNRTAGLPSSSSATGAVQQNPLGAPPQKLGNYREIYGAHPPAGSAAAAKNLGDRLVRY